MSTRIVVKVGGSLFDVPQFGLRLRNWLRELNAQELLLVPGGGQTANVIRRLDEDQNLGEETAHWLALRALTFNAHFLAAILPEAAMAADIASCEASWRRGSPVILDAHAFAVSDEADPDHLPHLWAVSSDSVAARAASVFGADQLMLLKSVNLPYPYDWNAAADWGVVDSSFLSLIAHAKFEVRIVNFRGMSP